MMIMIIIIIITLTRQKTKTSLYNFNVCERCEHQKNITSFFIQISFNSTIKYTARK